MAFIYISNGPDTIIEKLGNHFGSNDFFIKSLLAAVAGVICTGGDMGGEERGEEEISGQAQGQAGTWTEIRRSQQQTASTDEAGGG